MMQEIRALQAVTKMNALSRSERRHRGIHANLPLASAVLLALAVAGCNRTRNADVLATVNGKAIMKADVDKAYAAQLGEAQQQQQLSPEQSDSLKLNVLQA